MNRLFATGIAFVLCTTGFAQVRKYSNEFLNIGVSARALGMSNAVVASVNDVTSGYWNPAGLNRITCDLQVGFMHSEYFAGIAKYDYGSISLPARDKSGRMALSIIRLGIDDIHNTLFLIEPDGSINYDNVTSFSAADYAFIFSYAQPIKWQNLHLGGNAKVIHRRAGNFARAWGFGFDFGAQWEKKRWRLGAMARDITTTFNAWSVNFTEEEQHILEITGNIIPDNDLELTVPRLILAAAWQHDLTERVSFISEVNVDMTTDGQRNVLIPTKLFSFEPHLGVEFGYADVIFIRGGIGNIQRHLAETSTDQVTTLQFNLGVGLKLKSFVIDYAYTDIGDQSQSLYSHVFSLRADITRKTP